MESTLNSPPAPARAGAGSLSWVWQAVTGVGLVALAGLHMIAHHFVVEGGLRNFAQVQEYIRHPLIWPLEILFLVCVTAHALLGVRAIIFDLGLSDAAERRVTQVLWGVGLLTVAYGVWLTWVLVTYPA